MAEKRAVELAPRKVAVVLEGGIRKRLKVYVAGQDRKLKAVINEALDEYLRKRGA